MSVDAKLDQRTKQIEADRARLDVELLERLDNEVYEPVTAGELSELRERVEVARENARRPR